MYNDYLNIQMLQGRLVLYANSQMFDRIFDDIFAGSDDIALYLPWDHIEAFGRSAVKDFYLNLGESARINGNTLGTDQGTSQYITLGRDGTTAKGRWYTYTVRIEGPAFGNYKAPYPYHIFIGRYDNVFIKGPLGWRLKTLCWEPLYDLGSYPCVPEENGNLHKDVLNWPPPYPFFKGGISSLKTGEDLKDEKDQKDAQWCRDVLEIEQLHGAFIDAWNRADFSAMARRFFAGKSPSLFCQGLPLALNGIDSIEKYFTWLKLRAKAYGRGIQLATSRVIEVEPGGKRARGMWTSLTLEALCKSDGAHVKMSNRTGRWYIDFIKENGQWKYKSCQWHMFCEMTPFFAVCLKPLSKGGCLRGEGR